MGADRTFSVFIKYVKKNSKEFGFTKGKSTVSAINCF